MTRWFFIIFFIVPLLLSSCGKDPLTLPARVTFDFEFIAHEEESSLKNTSEEYSDNVPPNVAAGKLEVNKGKLAIESIEFDGRREEGRDIFFISDLPGPLVVDLETGTGNQELSFDIPQGVYNLIDIYFNMGGDNQIPLILEGKIKRGAAYEMPVRFEFNIQEQLRVRAESKNQSSKIVLRKDTTSNAKIVVDAESIFKFVNPSVLRNASVSVIDGKELILVNNNNNNGIFNSLASRVEKSVKVIFN